MIGTFKIDNANLDFDFKDEKYVVSFDIAKDSVTAIKHIMNELKEHDSYMVTIDKQKKKRTLDQNAYLWVLCDRISKAISSTKEEVYREIVRKCGLFRVAELDKKTAGTLLKGWENQGIGWFYEKLSESGKNVKVMLYYGTSCYNTAQMKRIIDEVIYECGELKIPTQVNGYEEEAQ